ncbi:Methyltransferase domain-containing protein [Actinopolymorpha cephalotaxi]|uniref:Methyltransferase domain-containing protein n=1 Tax=Actinopolymorpha cephalotaxi TaxID=504797 RepID=A0A1I2N9R2_9ACTN|nr:methyltransferase domain-containing protein [Actinopolymorpha cephalotaxi]NYH85626.1 hypothetical protein [Actinopolymorpha cephalotaxi]SFG00293.1 Methyltransferase domain-containing protein [Actinopolymorpha cephalotaxi]
MSDSIGEYLVSARSFAEYSAFFDLGEDDLRGSVLDCPGGGASFTATAASRGADAIAADPAYADPPAEVAARVRAEVDRGGAWVTARTGRYEWGFHHDPETLTRGRAESARLFAADITAHPDCYRFAALPELPFADEAFDLVLSSHFLFTYADRLDRDFHLAALRELRRVARGQVRVFPLVDQAGGRLDGLVDDLVRALTADDVRAERRRVPYEFQRGADTMLVLHPPGR